MCGIIRKKTFEITADSSTFVEQTIKNIPTAVSKYKYVFNAVI